MTLKSNTLASDKDCQNADCEVFKPVKGYEGLYMVGSLGTIVSITHLDSMGRTKPGKTMKPLRHNHGYLSVGLCHEGKKTRFLIHRIVAEAFVENKDAKETVNHINGVKNDNRAENLEWCSYAENNKHAHKAGLNYISKSNREATSARMKKRHQATRERNAASANRAAA